MEQLQRGRRGFIIYEEMCKYLTITEEAVSHIWLCNSSILNFLINEENLIFFFTGVFCLTTFITKKLRSETLLSGVRRAISVKRGSPVYGVLWSTYIHFNIRNLARERCDRDIFIHTPPFTFFLSFLSSARYLFYISALNLSLLMYVYLKYSNLIYVIVIES
jgi:hypothetical protein